MYLTIYKIARNKVKINTDQYWIQKKKKKKRSYQRRKLLHVSIISETIDICIRLNICNFATGIIQRCYKCTTAGVQQGTGRKRGRKSLPLLALQRIFTKVVFLDLHVASRHRSYFKASMHACTNTSANTRTPHGRTQAARCKNTTD